MYRMPPTQPGDEPDQDGLSRLDRRRPRLLLQVRRQHAADDHPETAAELATLTTGSDDSTPMNRPPSSAGWYGHHSQALRICNLD